MTKKNNNTKMVFSARPVTQEIISENAAAEAARIEAESKHVNTLWGTGCKFSTQAEYQRSCLGSKWSK